LAQSSKSNRKETMKTNHQRGFVDQGSFRDRSCQEIAVSRLSGRSTRIGNDFNKGHRGHARAVHGAKQAIRTSDRRFNRDLARKVLIDRAEFD